MPLPSIKPRLQKSLAILLLSTAAVAQAQASNNWDATEAQIASELKASNDKSSLSTDLLLHLPTVQNLAARKDLPLFNEMTAYSDKPLLAVCGYVLIANQFPENSFEAGCRILMNTDEPAFLPFGIICIDLNKAATDNPSLDEQFNKVLQNRPTADAGLLLLLQSLPPGFLQNWWAHRSTNILVSNEAMIVDTLMASTTDENTKKDLLHRIDTYRSFPGYPRLVYLHFGKPPADQIPRLLSEVLGDDSISDMSAIGTARQYKQELETIDLTTLKISPRRMDLLKRALKPKK